MRRGRKPKWRKRRFGKKFNGTIANFRQVCRGRIYASRAVYPLYRIIGTVATGGIIAVPTSQPVNLLFPYGRGRGVPRPYTINRPIDFFYIFRRGAAYLIYYLLSFIYSFKIALPAAGYPASAPCPKKIPAPAPAVKPGRGCPANRIHTPIFR